MLTWLIKPTWPFEVAFGAKTRSYRIDESQDNPLALLHQRCTNRPDFTQLRGHNLQAEAREKNFLLIASYPWLGLLSHVHMFLDGLDHIVDPITSQPSKEDMVSGSYHYSASFISNVLHWFPAIGTVNWSKDRTGWISRIKQAIQDNDQWWEKAGFK